MRSQKAWACPWACLHLVSLAVKGNRGPGNGGPATPMPRVPLERLRVAPADGTPRAQGRPTVALSPRAGVDAGRPCSSDAGAVLSPAGPAGPGLELRLPGGPAAGREAPARCGLPPQPAEAALRILHRMCLTPV